LNGCTHAQSPPSPDPPPHAPRPPFVCARRDGQFARGGGAVDGALHGAVGDGAPARRARGPGTRGRPDARARRQQPPPAPRARAARVGARHRFSAVARRVPRHRSRLAAAARGGHDLDRGLSRTLRGRPAAADGGGARDAHQPALGPRLRHVRRGAAPRLVRATAQRGRAPVAPGDARRGAGIPGECRRRQALHSAAARSPGRLHDDRPALERGRRDGAGPHLHRQPGARGLRPRGTARRRPVRPVSAFAISWAVSTTCSSCSASSFRSGACVR
jgi:hypothetical protein